MEEQITLFTNLTSTMKNCAFTGHRHLSEDFSFSSLKDTIIFCIEKGAECFYNGMAIGFDLLAAECVLSLKKEYPQIKLIACVPYYGQEKYYNEQDKERYKTALKKADETHILAESYYRGCLHNRNRFMVEHADVLIAYCNNEKGGTAYTVNCFRKYKSNNPIYFI